MQIFTNQLSVCIVPLFRAHTRESTRINKGKTAAYSHSRYLLTITYATLPELTVRATRLEKKAVYSHSR